MQANNAAAQRPGFEIISPLFHIEEHNARGSGTRDKAIHGLASVRTVLLVIKSPSELASLKDLERTMKADAAKKLVKKATKLTNPVEALKCVPLKVSTVDG